MIGVARRNARGVEAETVVEVLDVDLLPALGEQFRDFMFFVSEVSIFVISGAGEVIEVLGTLEGARFRRICEL